MTVPLLLVCAVSARDAAVLSLLAAVWMLLLWLLLQWWCWWCCCRVLLFKHWLIFLLLSGRFPLCSSISAAVGHESSYTWEGVNTAACDEILWGLLTINRAMAIQEGDDLEPANVSLKVCAADKICGRSSTVLLGLSGRVPYDADDLPGVE